VDYSKICFVIMPFATKDVAGKPVNFDAIYDRIFEPAIRRVNLPETGNLEPRRTDKDFFSGDISNEMFRYIEYSRFALTDITGLNANVFYELGARHRVRDSVTAIFRQANAPIPFDINSIKAFQYEYEPETQAETSRTLVSRVLTESLVQNRLDSPIRIALAAQQEQAGIPEQILKDAENAIRNDDFERAILLYGEASRLQPTNPLTRMKLGILLKDRGRWVEALREFETVVSGQPSYAEAWREKGIAENKLAQEGIAAGTEPPLSSPLPGEEALRRAIQLNPGDFDALASLGGVLKAAHRYAEAREAYLMSRKASSDHPYPLLNEIKLRAMLSGKLELEPRDRRALARAGMMREKQIAQEPPYDKPWCFFDLAEIRLYSGKPDESLELIRQGLINADHDWQGATFLKSLEMLAPLGAAIRGLDPCLELLRDWQLTGNI
jgi:tetratricopeptide (TPR) repeat protein